MTQKRLHLMLSPENADWLQSQVQEGYGISRLVDSMITAHRTLGPIMGRLERAVTETIDLIQTRQGKNLPPLEIHVEINDETGEVMLFADHEDVRVPDIMTLAELLESSSTPEEEALRAHHCHSHPKGTTNAPTE